MYVNCCVVRVSKIEMADKAERPCPCTDPQLPQFAWVSREKSVRQGKRLVYNFCFGFAVVLALHLLLVTQC